MKKNSALSKKMTKYSVLAGAAITMIAACKKDDSNDPNIIETDVNPDISITSMNNSGNEVEIDINGDGILDVSIGAYNYNYTYGGTSTSVNYGYISGLNGGQVLTQSESIIVGGNSYIEDFATALSEGNSIGPSQVTWLDYGYLGLKGTYYGQEITAGQFLGQDKYVGLSIQAAGNTHYAWMRLSMTADGSNVTVYEYAYHINPNTPIEAGAK